VLPLDIVDFVDIDETVGYRFIERGTVQSQQSIGNGLGSFQAVVAFSPPKRFLRGARQKIGWNRERSIRVGERACWNQRLRVSTVHVRTHACENARVAAGGRAHRRTHPQPSIGGVPMKSRLNVWQTACKTRTELIFAEGSGGDEAV